MKTQPASRPIILCGTEQPDVVGRILTAGPLSVELDNGNLRYLKVGGVEVLRSLSFLVRDENWGTYIPALEAIETVSVVTGSFDADQGLSGGMSANVQMKSGSNELHGSLFGYHFDSALKARPYFLPANERKPKAINNQLGGTLGGRIIRDKLFYFGSYEGEFDRQTGGRLLTVPTAAIRAGNMAAVREMAGELAVWFAKHTQTLDAALALHMRSVRSEAPARRTHRANEHPASAP